MIISSLKFIKRKLILTKNFFVRQYWFAKRSFVSPELPKNADGKVYINLGSGVHTSKEFTNVDTLPYPWVHYINEVQLLPMCADNSADLIYASHLVEHIPREQLLAALKEWHRVLKPGGVFRMGVPSFDALIKIYELSGKDVHSIENQLLGQECPYNDHHTIWNDAFAKEIFEKAGFKEVRKWDPQTADHHGFGDKSTRVIRVKDVDVPISLNIEAVK